MKTAIEPEKLYVVLVDEDDNPVGVEEKLKAHQNGGVLHRAFSVFILNEAKEILLQQRAESKYHCPTLWSNSCCSHPPLEKTVLQAAVERLSVELGFTTELCPISKCTYHLAVDKGLTEWEINHVLVGHYSGSIHPNPIEAKAIRWCDFQTLQKELMDRPDIFTPWLHEIFPSFARWFKQTMGKQ